MVKERLAEWMAEENEEDDRSRGSERFNNLLTDWSDSIKHHRAASGVDAAKHNRKLTLTYLEKIREILDQTNENAQQIQAVPEQGEGEPQPGEGDQEGEPEEGDGGEEGEEEGDQGSNGDDPEEGGDGGEERDTGEEPDNGDSKESEKESTDKEPRPGETPEEAARRILNENADMQKGALSPGRIRFQRPEKDW